MAFDRNRVQEFLINRNYSGLRQYYDDAEDDEKQTITDAVNQKSNGYLKSTLLYDVIKSNKLRSKEAVVTLIKLGAKPTETDVNGNTPLHAAASYMNFKNEDDEAIVRALLDTRHVENFMCADPINPPQPVDPQQPADPADPPQPTNSTNPPQLADPAGSSQPADQADSSQHTEFSDYEGPLDLSGTSEPTEPQHPLETIELACRCGLRMLLQRNKHLKYPKEIRSIVRECYQILIVEELLYVLEKENQTKPSNLKLENIFKFINRNINDFPRDFPSKLIQKVIEVETEDNAVHLVLPMIFPSWSDMFTTHMDELSIALEQTKMKSYFMLCALIEIKKGTEEGKEGTGYGFIDTWNSQQPFVPRDFLPIIESFYDVDMEKGLKKFTETKENLGYLISVAANVTTGDDVVNPLLKAFSKLQIGNTIELRLSGLSLSQLNIHHKVFEDISEQFQFLDVSYNQLSKCPAIYKVQDPFQWHRLFKLKLNNNNLKEIDKEVFQMEFLIEINLNHNFLERLPDCQFKSSLQSLHLSHNKLVNLPDSLKKSVISSLYLENNRFESLPKCVCQMFALKDLFLDENKGIIDFPLEMGNMNPDTRISIKNMEQLCYPTRMIENPKLIINHLRAKLYEEEVNRTMNLMVIGPKSHGKTTIIDRIFNKNGYNNATTEVEFRDPYKFRQRGNMQPFVLNTIDFPGDIAFSANQCFLTNRTLYLLVWNVLKDPSTLSEWLHCLMSANVPDSLVMIVGNYKNQAMMRRDTNEWNQTKIEDRLWKYLVTDENKATQFYKKIHFGCWCKEDIGQHWFNYIDITNPKEIKKLKRNIRQVACSLPLCHTRSYDVKLLGGCVPTFYFYLKEYDRKKKFLDRADVHKTMRDGRLDEEERRCCCGERGLHIEDRDIDGAVRFLKDTGFLLHFEDVNQSLNDLYFMDLNWLKKLFKDLSKIADKDGSISNEQIRKKLMKYNLGDSIIQLIKSFNFGFSISKERMQLSIRWPTKGDEMLKEVKNRVRDSPNWESTEYLCRLHVFEDGSIPFGFWLKILSRFMLYIDKLVVPDIDTAYANYRASFDQTKCDNIHQLFAKNCKYSKEGFLYNDPDNHLFIVIRKITQNPYQGNTYDNWLFQSAELKGKAFIMTEVMSSDAKVCSYVFTKIINHIEIVIEEWYNLEGPYSNLPRLSPCTCVKVQEKPCTLYSREMCFSQFHQADYNERKTTFLCKHTGSGVPLVKLFPDLLAADCPNIVLKGCHQIKADRQIGEGGFGIVYQGDLTPCGNGNERLDTAVKVQKNDLVGDKRLDTIAFIEFKNEAVMSYHLADHPFITTFFGVRYNEKLVSYNNKRWVMVMERAVDSLSKKLSKNYVEKIHFNSILCYRIAYQIADALNFMHSMNIFNRDLKPANVLLFSEKIEDDINVKLSDFGTACYASSQGLKQSGVGTRQYQPPELFNWKSTYTFSVDIYAYGLILHELLTLIRPFAAKDLLGLKNIMKSEEKFKSEFKHSKVRKDRICLQRLMERCTEYHLTERQMGGEGLIFLLQQPCFQLLMNSLPSYVKEDFHLQSFLGRKESSRDFCYISMSENQFIKLHHSSFKVNNPENEDFLNPQRLRTLTPPYFIETIHFYDIFDHEDDVVFAMIAQTNDGIRLTVYRLGSKTENPLEAVGNEMTVLRQTAFDCEINDVRKIMKATLRGNFLYLYLEDTEGKLDLKRQEWPPPYIPERKEIGSTVVIENDKIYLEPWNICEHIKNQNINNIIDIFIEDCYKLVAFLDVVVILTNVCEDRAFRETDSWSSKDKNDQIKQLFIYHPYVLILHDSKKLTFLKLEKLESEGCTDFKFDVNFEKSHRLSILNGSFFDIVSFCGIFNKIWLGTNTGHIFILTIPTETDDIVKQTLIRPYQSKVKDLLPFNIQVGGSFPEFVISYGEVLNEDAFMSNIKNLKYPKGLKRFHLDRLFLGYKTDVFERFRSRDLFLMWHATDGKELEAYEMNTYESKVTNEKLEKLSKHAENCINA